ncbi:MAG: class I SAM-dependent methyltransferase [Candidatus Aminicenantes bacterium]|nr:class I SAM-dependent methyltransferase [Candidatus Aminicenantes bacterium]
MEKDEYRKHFELEDAYWWFIGRRLIMAEILRPLEREEPRLRILDIGCGTGINLVFLGSYGEPCGCDLFSEALDFSRRRGLRQLVRAGVERLPFSDGSFDLVTALDVISHRSVPSENAALREAARVLKKGGRLLVLDSAFPVLHGRHDRACHIGRRYVRRTLDRICRQAGLEPERRGYYNFFLFPAVAAVRLTQKFVFSASGPPVSNLKPIPPGLNAFLIKLMRLEARLTRSLNLPFGSTVFCLARKH